ncbi:hypothetical protein BDF20DRAFT_953128 [Mycotypha africana]|uniref:uncharacterized protein n=1 Tax=Mycotypha africana TaxID=64632 RepID=UPI002301C45B|nr:uncharacterized protein BDF20DRAFT_953128 [Mycotypha africana]KAI8988231.1 hypothetical protein BDF20DRAFT_953128 [Mycotypha africana]
MSSPQNYQPDVETSSFEERLKNKNIRSMPVGNERLAALRDLGATFDEGRHKTTKIATPSGTPKIPAFVDAGQIERLLQQKSTARNPFSASISSSRGDFTMSGE